MEGAEIVERVRDDEGMGLHHGIRIRVVALAATIAIAAAACGGSADQADAGAPTPTAPATPTATAAPGEPGDEGEPTGTDDGGEVDARDEGADQPPAVELTATHQGVTATEIAFGVAAIDAELLLDFGVDIGVVPIEQMYVAWADAQNRRGGIHGRDLVPHTRLFLPVGQAAADTVCLELAEDIGVFVTIGQMIGDTMTCFFETYGLPYIGHFGMQPELSERSGGLFIATEMAGLDQRTGGVAAMIEAGDFDGKRVAVTWENPGDSIFGDGVLPLLGAAGIEIVAIIEGGDFAQDTAAADAAWDVIMERIAAEQADVIVHLSNLLTPINAAERAGLDIEIAYTNGQLADQFIFLDAVADDARKARTFGVTTAKPTPAEALADPDVARCLEEFTTAFPDLALDTTDLEDVAALTNHCRSFALMVETLQAAGPELTPDSWIAGWQGLATFELPAMRPAQLSADSPAAGSLLARYEYDPDQGFHVRVGDPFPPPGD